MQGLFSLEDAVELKERDSTHKSSVERDFCRVLKLVTTVATSKWMERVSFFSVKDAG
jgi:hypothetical protein